VDLDQYTKGYIDAFEEFKDAQILTPGPLHAPVAGAYKGRVLLLVDGFATPLARTLWNHLKPRAGALWWAKRPMEVPASPTCSISATA
ncbi:MAG: hypothetical protein M3N54_13685, partial [Acidobacteriota bacterium]|nr:hypothetical protein [Acidobacteriota bacterium]